MQGLVPKRGSSDSVDGPPRPRIGPFALILLAGLAVAGVGAGDERAPRGASAAGPGEAEAFFRAVLDGGGLPAAWVAESPPEIADGREGLTSLFDGAADALWQKGLRKAALQVFRPTGSGGGSLELLRYRFAGDGSARAFMEDNCPSGKGEPDPSCGRITSCLAEQESLTQAFFQVNGQILEARAYGDRELRRKTMQRLPSGFCRIASSGREPPMK
ncbi:MAG: hypothetical protein AB1640_18165 [bacterium]